MLTKSTTSTFIEQTAFDKQLLKYGKPLHICNALSIRLFNTRLANLSNMFINRNHLRDHSSPSFPSPSGSIAFKLKPVTVRSVRLFKFCLLAKSALLDVCVYD